MYKWSRDFSPNSTLIDMFQTLQLSIVSYLFGGKLVILSQYYFCIQEG